ncbi:hypothetical protein B0O99DRAFT_595441 [Bisporella sp. PMI_857]|nr:hypothetical protein B0O99DRAFT_595441 [Bisporella sp. PMI_857]
MVHDAVLVTGCTKGSIGSGIAIAFQARGIHVFATARSLANVSHLAKVPNITTLEALICPRLTLCLELEPFGVNVITVIAGMIVSNFFTPVEEKFALPPTSKYRHFEEALGKKARGEELPPNRMSNEEFGRLVCGDVLRGKRGNIYRGTLAWTLPLIGVLPRWYIDWYCRGTGGLQNSQKDKQA